VLRTACPFLGLKLAIGKTEGVDRAVEEGVDGVGVEVMAGTSEDGEDLERGAGS
jgi:hypothetical protein